MSEMQQTDGVFTRVLTQVLAGQCRQVQALGGVMLRCVENNNLAVLAAFPPTDSDNATPTWIHPALDTCREVFSSGKTAIVAGMEQQGPDAPPQNPIIVIPIEKEDAIRAVAVFLVPHEDPQKIEIVTKQLENTALLLDQSELVITLENHRQAFERLNLALDVLSVCNRSSHFTSVSMALCNALAEKVRCQRVSLGVLKGRYAASTP